MRTSARSIGLWAVMGWIVLCLSSVKNKIAYLKNILFSIAAPLRFILVCLIASAMMMVSASPAAAVQKVQDLGTNSTKTNGQTLTLTLSSAVTNGNSVIISFAADDGGGAVTCSDDAGTGNSYSVDVDETNTNNVRSLICSAHNVSGLTSGKIITVTTTNSISARAMSVTEFSSLVTSATLDQTQKNNGTGTAPSSTATSTTTVANELLIGAIGVENKLPSVILTPGNGWTNLPKDGTGTGAPTSNITITSEYQIVSSTGTYTADGTISSNDWAAAIATYKRLDYYLDQVAYRWRNDDGTEATATYTWGENDKIYGIPKGSGVQRLRFLVANEGTQGTGAIGYQLQVAETATCSSGTYSAVPTGTSGDWQIIASQLSDGVATDSGTAGLTDPVGYTWTAGEQKDSGNTTGTITLAASYFTEIEFSVQATTNATDNGDYCFRLIDAGGIGLDNYTVYAQARIIPATAITLASFNAQGENNSVRVDWETGQEINNLGFNLYRSTSPAGPFVKINDSLIPGLIYSVKGKSYSYIDTAVTPGKLYYYKLEDIDASGTQTFHGPVCVDWDSDGIPDDWEIAHGLNPWVNDADLDADNDGLSNWEEYKLGFDPFNPDSDGDGILDGQEGYRIEREDANGSKGLTRGVQILSSDESGVTLELSTDTFDTEVVTAGGQEFERLRIADYIHGHTQVVGQPEVPVKGIFLDLPQGQSATLSVLKTEFDTYNGYQVFPVPENIVDEQGTITAVGESFVWDESAYEIDAFYPDVIAQLGDGFVFRGQSKQQILFYPLTFNPASGQLGHHRKIQVRIDFVDTDSSLAKADTLSSAPWQLPITNGTSDSVPLAGQLAIAFGAAPIMVNPISPVLSSLGILVNALWSPDIGAQGTAYKILVEEEGIYRLTRDYLANNGVAVAALDLSQIRIYNLGTEIAISIYDQNGDDVIDSSDTIEFYGRPATAPYAKYGRHNVYWLVTAGGIGTPKRMLEIDGTPAAGALAATHTYTLHHEDDEYYHGSAPGDESLDRWFFDDLVLGSALTGTPDPVPVDFTINLPGVAGQGSLTISMWGYYDTYHDLEIQVNGVTANIANWSGISFHEVTLSGINLLEGDNIITLICNRDMDAVIVDWFEITYPRMFEAFNNTLKFSHDSGYRYQISDFVASNLVVFDITQATETARVVNLDISGTKPYTLEFEPPVNPGATETYLVLTSDASKIPVGLIEDTAADLALTANGADYILITHRDLGWDANGDAYGWLDDLVALREGQGLRVKVVDVQDIFDEFSYGMTSAAAIRDFLSYAYSNWEPPAPQYILLVGDSSYDFRDNLQLGITNYVPAYLTFTQYMGETVTDEWFVKISGGDAVPDLYIGRLPAESDAEAAVMINKILTYETSPNDKTWQKNTLLIADNQSEAYEAAFEAMNEDASDLLPASMNAPFKGYLNDYLASSGLKDDIKAQINAGTLIVNYSGHGSFQRWAGERIFQNSDVADLTNAGKYPFVVNMSCLTGYFGYLHPVDGPEPSLAEALLKADGKGAIAALMPTAMTSTGGQRILDSALFEAIFQKDIRQLGPGIADAKQTLLANGGAAYEEISETFLLFGDPALALLIPIPHKPTGIEVERTQEGIVISWQAAEDNSGNPVAGYNVYRSSTPGGNYIKINTELITDTEFVDTDPGGVGASEAGASGGGAFYYGVASVDADGDESAQTLGSSPAAVIESAAGAVGCFIGAASKSVPKHAFWLVVGLTIVVAVCYRRQASGFGR
jgi:hypothetical protein